MIIRASWPSLVCPSQGMHRWRGALETIYCEHCYQYIAVQDMPDYNEWTRYWADPVKAAQRVN